MPSKKILGFARERKSAIDYVAEHLTARNINFRVSYNHLQVNYIFEADERVINDLITDVILSIYKFAELSKILKKTREIEFGFSAYIGSILSVDREAEKEKIESRIIGEDVFLTVDGFCDFVISDVVASWQNLAKIANKLLLQCTSEQDVFDLTTFMLGVDGEGKRAVTLDNVDTLRLFIDKNPVQICHFFDEESQNIIATILMHHPKNIVVARPDKIDAKLIKMIKSLGE